MFSEGPRAHSWGAVRGWRGRVGFRDTAAPSTSLTSGPGGLPPQDEGLEQAAQQLLDGADSAREVLPTD
ncbi:hypothetical protein [Streptomyces sp. NPDC018833]|uniref:hypothetical protein n=1 Tax=Streptomyces sp. NPDC018833 TaxID=3365053 RepID=UPI0037B47EC8